MKKNLIFGVTALLVVAMGASLAFAATPDVHTRMNSMMNQEQMNERNNSIVTSGMSTNGTMMTDETMASNNMINNTRKTHSGNMMGNNYNNHGR